MGTWCGLVTGHQHWVTVVEQSAQFAVDELPYIHARLCSFPMHPEGLTGHLMDAKQLGVPIYVTEFGAADRQDRLRPDLIRNYYIAVRF